MLIGGWDLTGLSASFEYLLLTPLTLRQVGRVLAGWSADGGGLSPRLAAVPAYDKSSPDFNPTYHQLLTSWGLELFGANAGRNSQSYRDLLLATVLRYREYSMKYGRDDFVVKCISATAQSFGIKLRNC